jgi:hypothetical protein
MKGEFVLLFVILLLGLILCSYLGGNTCVEGMTSSISDSNIDPELSTNYTSDNGSTLAIKNNEDGTNTLIVKNIDETVTMYNSSSGSAETNTYYNDSGGKAVLTNDANGDITITVTNNNGEIQSIFQGRTGNTYNVSDTISTTTYDNYNHYTGSSYASVYYGPDGETLRVIDSGNGGTLVITNKNGTTEIYYINDTNNTNDININSYYGPNGGSAKIITNSDGKTEVEVTKSDGKKIIYTEENIYTSNQTNQYYDTNYNNVDTNYNNVNTNYNNVNTNTYYGPAGAITTSTLPNRNTLAQQTGAYMGAHMGPMPSTQNYDSSAYKNSLPAGIPKSQILPGQEDLYILKSEVVPPVCPKCPDPILKCNENLTNLSNSSNYSNNFSNGSNYSSNFSNSSNYSDNTKCPPCPPCARCPEPAFDCKKVPNYNAFNQNYMPIPVLNSFSSFGM